MNEKIVFVGMQFNYIVNCSVIYLVELKKKNQLKITINFSDALI